MDKYKMLEDYGIIGNLDACALISNEGSIDWCCFPHVESPSIFAKIIDVEKGGFFQINPTGKFITQQSYIDDTNVLRTIFKSSSAEISLTDFMPIDNANNNSKSSLQAIYRRVACENGKADIVVSFMPRFNYSRSETVIKLTRNGILASSGSEKLFLKSSASLQIDSGKATGVFNVKEGEVVWLVLRYGDEFLDTSESYEKLLDKTIRFWDGWRHSCDRSKCVFEGPWHDIAVRSGLVLKLLTHQETGAIFASPTTSLPEEIGGVRNWDYRYNWIRDSSFTVQALFNLGHIEEAKNHLSWFLKICLQTKDPSEIKIMYDVHGNRDMEEEELQNLSGYRDSRPARIGNDAVKQNQLDVYGELINGIYEVSRYGEDISIEAWEFVERVADYVCQVWKTKDAGIWEVRGKPQHFVHSKLMCWVALDRAIKIAKLIGDEAHKSKWEKARGEIKQAILIQGYNHELKSFVQSFDSKILDATSLLIPLMGFLPFNDPQVQSTIDAVIKYLNAGNGLVYRYNGEDGLPGKERAFILCSFWLVNVLALSGRVEEAESIFNKLLRIVSPLGLLSEEVDTGSGNLLGNFPQAFSHIGLINSALYLGKAKGRTQMGPEPMGD